MADWHFWTTDRAGELLTQPPWQFEGVACKILAKDSAEPYAVPLYRYFRPSNAVHFWTTNASEGAGFANYEGIVGKVYNEAYLDAIPLFRFSNAVDLEHFYTTDHSEGNNLSGWNDDGIQCYVLARDSTKVFGVPFYRFYQAAPLTYTWCIILLGGGRIVYRKTVTTSTSSRPDGYAISLLEEWNDEGGLPADSYQISAGSCPGL